MATPTTLKSVQQIDGKGEAKEQKDIELSTGKKVIIFYRYVILEDGGAVPETLIKEVKFIHQWSKKEECKDWNFYLINLDSDKDSAGRLVSTEKLRQEFAEESFDHGCTGAPGDWKIPENSGLSPGEVFFHRLLLVGGKLVKNVGSFENMLVREAHVGKAASPLKIDYVKQGKFENNAISSAPMYERAAPVRFGLAVIYFCNEFVEEVEGEDAAQAKREKQTRMKTATDEVKDMAKALNRQANFVVVSLSGIDETKKYEKFFADDGKSVLTCCGAFTQDCKVFGGMSADLKSYGVDKECNHITVLDAGRKVIWSRQVSEKSDFDQLRELLPTQLFH